MGYTKRAQIKTEMAPTAMAPGPLLTGSGRQAQPPVTRPTPLVTLLIVISNLALLTARTHSYESTISLSATKPSSSGDLDSTDSLQGVMDANYLLSDISDSAESVSASQVKEEISENSINNVSLGALKTSLSKSRKQAENQMKALDWWSKLAAKSRPAQSAFKGQRDLAARPSTLGPAIYREQPLSQNAILTIRNQLLAIRDKYRLLMTKSVAQLTQLDHRLIESYKLCMKKKMPLYAGMLYRTRDFVVRLANEVKHERQILEAMAKQTQRVLRHKMSNRTLVKEYNRLTSTSLSTPAPVSSYQQQQVRLQSSQANQQSSSWSHADDATTFYEHRTKKVKRSVDLALSASAARYSASTATQPTGGNRVLGRTKKENPNSSHDDYATDTIQQQPLYSVAVGATQTPTSVSKPTLPNFATDNSSKSRGKKKMGTVDTIFRSRKVPINSDQFSEDSYDQKYASELDFSGLVDDQFPIDSSTTTTTTTTTTTRKPNAQRQKTYTVHINEINLKRELVKTQALIDRINTSTGELMGVIDDIVFLFKLTSDDYNSRKGLSLSGKTSKHEKIHGASSMLMDIASGSMDSKRAKKMLKSPFKVFFERYGKLTMSSPATDPTLTTHHSADSSADSTTSANMKLTTPSDNGLTTTNLVNIDTSDLPELKPLFDQASFTTYKEPSDFELGFDAPITIDS